MNHAFIANGLLAFLLLVMPLWGWLDMRRLKRLDSAQARIRSYSVGIATTWLLALICLAVFPFATLWQAPPGFAERLGLEHIPSGMLPGMLVAFGAGLFAPVLMARKRPEQIARQLDPIRAMLPTDRTQGWLFVLVCLTAGICEEWIYRGFLLNWLMVGWPDANAWLLLVIAVLLFGVAHIYQGFAGVVMTSFLGLIFTLLHLAIGNLALSMLLHALIDLRILLLLKATADHVHAES